MKNKAALLILPMALCLVGCSKKDNEKQNTQKETEEIAVVDVQTATMRPVSQDKSYTATVEAFNVNNISPNSPNRIKSIAVEVGDHVTRGQVLVVMDNSNATQLKVNLDQTELQYNRAVQLLNIGSGTQAQVDALKAQLDAAREQYRNVMENVRLTSPITGVVTARNLDPGDMSGQQPILTVGQIQPNVKLIINITENDRAQVHTGMETNITFDAFPDQEYHGKISRIYPNIDPATRTFQAEVLVPNPKQELFPGMFARVTLSQGVVNRVVVSDRAIVKQPGSGNQYIYVYKNGTVTYNLVKLGQRLGSEYELIEGVAEGDSLVISGQSRLRNGGKAKLNVKK